MEDAMQPLYTSCQIEDTKLSVTVELLSMKARHQWSNKNTNELEYGDGSLGVQGRCRGGRGRGRGRVVGLLEGNSGHVQNLVQQFMPHYTKCDYGIRRLQPISVYC